MFDVLLEDLLNFNYVKDQMLYRFKPTCNVMFSGLRVDGVEGNHRHSEGQERRGPDRHTRSLKQPRKHERFGDFPGRSLFFSSVSPHISPASLYICLFWRLSLFFLSRLANSSSELMWEHLQSQQSDQHVQFGKPEGPGRQEEEEKELGKNQNVLLHYHKVFVCLQFDISSDNDRVAPTC